MSRAHGELVDLLIGRLEALLDARDQSVNDKLDSMTLLLRDQVSRIQMLTSAHGAQQMCPSGSPTTAELRTQGRLHTSQGRYCFSRNSTDVRSHTDDTGTDRSDLGTSHQSSLQRDVKPHGWFTTSLWGIFENLEPTPKRRPPSSWRVVVNEIGLPRIVTTKSSSQYLRGVVESPRFDFFWLGIIVLNALFLGFQLEYQVVAGHSHSSFLPFEVVFGILFMIELAMRLGGVGCKMFFFGANWLWGVFDLAIVMLTVVDVTLNMCEIGPPQSRSPLRVTRMLRILRLARIIRGIRFMRNLRLLISGILNSFFAISWTLFALAILMYMGAIIIMSVVAEKVTQGTPYYVEHWGGITSSMFTLFQVMTGDSWWTKVVAGIREDYPGIELVFIAYYSVTAYGLLNIVTGIFVEQTLSTSRNDSDLLMDRSDESRSGVRKFLRELFQMMDANGDRKVHFDEFERFMREPQVQFGLELINLKADDLRNLFNLLDRSGDKVIDIHEFVRGCMKARSPPNTADIIEHAERITRVVGSAMKEIHATCMMTLRPQLQDATCLSCDNTGGSVIADARQGRADGNCSPFSL